MNANGTFATGNFTIAEAPGRQLRPVVGWDGSSFVVAWDDQRNQGSFFDERTDVYGTRVSETGAILDPSGFAIEAGPQGDATAAILCRGDGVSFVGSARFQTAPPFDTYRVGITMLGLDAIVTAPDGLPASAAGARVAPNPFMGRTRVEFALPAPDRVRLAIHDMSGRLVRTLRNGETLAAGRHAVAWDGRDENGRDMASGVYFARIEAGDRVAQVRMTLVRR